MVPNFSAKITVDAKDKTRAVYDSVNTDNESYPENPTRTRINLDKKITILVESDHLPHLRANLNSTLRLVQASHEAIESAGMTGAGDPSSDLEPHSAKSKGHADVSRPRYTDPFDRLLDELESGYQGASRPCPRCKGTRLAELVWGMMPIPADKKLQRRLQRLLDSGDLEQCGCVIPYSNPPRFRCRDCDVYVWGGCVYGKPREY